MTVGAGNDGRKRQGRSGPARMGMTGMARMAMARTGESGKDGRGRQGRERVLIWCRWFVHEKVLFHGETMLFVEFVHQNWLLHGKTVVFVRFVHQNWPICGENRFDDRFVHRKRRHHGETRDCRSGPAMTAMARMGGDVFSWKMCEMNLFELDGRLRIVYICAVLFKPQHHAKRIRFTVNYRSGHHSRRNPMRKL